MRFDRDGFECKLNGHRLLEHATRDTARAAEAAVVFAVAFHSHPDFAIAAMEMYIRLWERGHRRILVALRWIGIPLNQTLDVD